MNARVEVVRVRAWLTVILGLRALAWGIAAALLLAGAEYIAKGTYGLRLSLPFGTIVAAAIAWRTRWPREVWRVALWVEEQVPALRFRLVSATDSTYESRWPQLDRSLPPIPWLSLRSAAARRALAIPLAVAASLAVAVGLLPAARAAGIVPAAVIPGRSPAPARGLGALRVRVTEPAYAGGAMRIIDEPADVAALVGSTIDLDVSSGSTTVASSGGSALRLIGSGGAWRARLLMPPRPTVVRLLAAGSSRLFTLTPRPDSSPALVIRAPGADTTVRAPTGRITLHAIARDDIGIVLAGFEYIVSSGAGESFTFKSGMLGLTRLTRAREAELHATVDLSVLGLRPGDVVHVRAVAGDGLAPATPGSASRWRGASETRVIRVALAGEYDSVAVEGAPPPDIEGALSQRMLLMLTEALEKRRARLGLDDVRAESRRIAVEQTKLRKRVGAIIFDRLGGSDEGEHAQGEADERLAGRLDPAALLAQADAATNKSGTELQEAEGDDSPVVAVNRPLLEAYNHMWDAQRALEVATPGRAIGPMRLAIAALQRARAAERIYLRGRPPAVVVDVARVRLSGRDVQASLSSRTPRRSTEAARRVLAVRLGNAANLVSRDAAAAVDSLLLVRVDALTVAPEAATALGRAAAALRRGGNAAGDLALARRLLLGPARVEPLAGWTGGPW